MSESNEDDWAMTQLNIRIPKEPSKEGFDKTSPNFDPTEISEFVDWHVKPTPQRARQSSDFDKTYIPGKEAKSDDWDLTQANIKIPKNDVVNFNLPNERQDDWGMTTPHIDKGYMDMDFSAVSPPRSDSIAMPRSGMTQVGSPAPKKINQPNIPVAEVSTQKKEAFNVNKWLYFLAGAFTMFVFMMVFLTAIYLIIFFK
jgi:hypothetical protein